MDVIIHREQVYDPYRGEFVYKLSQTHSVKRSRSCAGGAGTITLATYAVGVGSVAKMTYLHVSMSPTLLGNAGVAVNCCDRYGTYDRIHLTHGTYAYSNRERADRLILQGDANSPIHTLYGTIRFHKGGVVVGTVTVSYELVISSGMPYREGTVTRY